MQGRSYKLLQMLGNRPFPGFRFKTRVVAQPLKWKRFFILMQIKLIFARKVVHPASFWKWGFLEFGSGLFEWTFSNLSVRGSTSVFRSGTGRDSPAWSCEYLYRFISEQEPIMARDRSRWFPLLSLCGNLIGSKPVPNCPFTVWAEAFSQRELKFFCLTRTALGLQSFWWHFRWEFWACCSQDSLNKMLEAFDVSWQQSFKRKFAEQTFVSSSSVVCDANFSECLQSSPSVVCETILDSNECGARGTFWDCG